MADNGSKSMLTQVREFIRDVGTPTAVLLFVGLVYTGYLPSPLTIMEKEHQTMIQAQYAELGVLRRMCRNQSKTEADKDLCDDPNQAIPEKDRWGIGGGMGLGRETFEGTPPLMMNVK
jgi:hypothetical protein